MKFNGTEWQFTGPPGFSAGEELWQDDIAVSPAGIPYIFYRDLETGSGHCLLSVLKYDSVYTGINESGGSGFSLFPNPVLSLVTFKFEAASPIFKRIGIFNIQGIKVFETTTCESSITVNAENLPVGLYLVRIETSNTLYFRKFCKQ